MEPRVRQRRKPMAEINVVPLIDVMLVLLIVFMITAPLITQGVKVDLPNADAEPVDDPEEESLVASIDEGGNYYLNLGDIDAEDPEPVSLENIADNVSRIMAQNPDLPVYLEADENVSYGVFMNLMSTLEGAGATGVRLITEPPE